MNKQDILKEFKYRMLKAEYFLPQFLTGGDVTHRWVAGTKEERRG